MPSPAPLLTHNPGMTSDGNRVNITGQEIQRRRLALGLDTPAQLARLARVSTRAAQKAEVDQAGATVLRKLARTLERLEAGEVIEEDPVELRLELRPGVTVTVEADNTATLGDLRDVEARLRRLIDDDGE